MYNSIVVGTDGSSSARGAVTRAARLAKLCNARLLIVSAYRQNNPSMMPALSGVAVGPPVGDARESVEAMLSRLADELARQLPNIETFAVPGNAAQAILEVAEAEKCDLIVLGNRGMQGVRRYLGSVPSNVAHQAPCSVLIVSTAG
jgi:nucleotide-binding universal stress UspA family protein